MDTLNLNNLKNQMFCLVLHYLLKWSCHSLACAKKEKQQHLPAGAEKEAVTAVWTLICSEERSDVQILALRKKNVRAQFEFGEQVNGCVRRNWSWLVRQWWAEHRNTAQSRHFNPSLIKALWEVGVVGVVIWACGGFLLTIHQFDCIPREVLCNWTCVHTYT